MNKWKTAFIVSFTLLLIVIVSASYIVLTNTLTSGHCKENQMIIAEDLDNISLAISEGAFTIEQFDQKLKELNVGHSMENESNLIRLQVVHLLFDKNGNFDKIETYD
jgi:hypothetical protein